MKKRIIVFVIILLAYLFISCNRHTCPTYGGRQSSGLYSNEKPLVGK